MSARDVIRATTREKYGHRTRYVVFWSDEDARWVATPDGEPTISALAGHPAEALSVLVEDVLPLVQSVE